MITTEECDGGNYNAVVLDTDYYFCHCGAV